LEDREPSPGNRRGFRWALLYAGAAIFLLVTIGLLALFSRYFSG